VSAAIMRAVAVDEFGGPESLRLVERPVPEPTAGEVSIDVAYAGVGFIDALLRSGAFPLSRPFVPGIEVTGRVRAVGPNVEGLAPGQHVAALLNDFGRTERIGGYAEVAVAHHTMVAALPSDADLPRITAVIANGAAAWMALHDVARLRPSDRVLVLGASGGLGATTARVAALHPAARVIGVVGHDPSRAPAECTDVVEADELEAWLGEDAIDVVIDPVGGRLRTVAFDHLAPFGRHVLVGNASGEDPTLSGDAAWLGTRVIAGLSVGGIAHVRPSAVATALSAVTGLVARGVLREPAPAIEPLENAVRVHQAIADRTAPPKTLLALSG
jgi:NADPH2:quinone reductase